MRNDTHHDNDNETLSFISLAALTANVVRHLGLDEKHDEDSRSEPNPGDADEERKERERQYINHRLKEIRAWERRISGRK
jgi:hypothetical protein